MSNETKLREWIIKIRDHVKGYGEYPPALYRVEEMCDEALKDQREDCLREDPQGLAICHKSKGHSDPHDWSWRE